MAKKAKHVKLTDQLRQIVRDCSLTPAEISRQGGIDKSKLSRFLSGERFVSPAVLDQLGDLLGLEIVMRSKPKR